MTDKQISTLKPIMILILSCAVISGCDFLLTFPHWYFSIFPVLAAIFSTISAFCFGTKILTLQTNHSGQYLHTYFSGLAISIICTLILTLGRLPLLSIHIPESSFNLQYLFSGLTPVQFLYAATALTFTAYTSAAFCCLMSNKHNTVLKIIIAIILFMTMFSLISLRPTWQNLLPNLYEQLPLYLICGTLYFIATFLLPPTRLSKGKPSTILLGNMIALLSIIIISFSLPFFFINSWRKPNISEANNIYYTTSTNAPNWLNINFKNRCSGYHRVIFNIKKNETPFYLPHYSTLLYNYLTDFIPGPESASYMLHLPQLLTDKSTVPPSFSQINLSNQYQTDTLPIFFNKQNDPQTYQEYNIDTLNNNFSIHRQGKLLVAKFSQRDAINYPFLRPFIKAGYITVIIQKMGGEILKQYHIPEKNLTQFIRNDNRLLLIHKTSTGNSWSSILNYHLINLDTFAESKGILPDDRYISRSLNKAAFIGSTSKNKHYHYTINILNLETNKRQVAIASKDLPSPGTDAKYIDIRYMFGPNLQHVFLYHRQSRRSNTPPTLTYFDLTDSKKYPVHFPLDKTESTKYKIRALGYSKNADFFYYSVIRYREKNKASAEQVYQYNCSTSESKALSMGNIRFTSPDNISPDGKFYLYSLFRQDPTTKTDYSELAIRNIFTGKQTIIHPAPQVTSRQVLNQYHWFKDTKIMFSSSTTIWTINQDGKELKQLFPF